MSKPNWFMWIQIALQRAGIHGELQGKVLKELMRLTKHLEWES